MSNLQRISDLRREISELKTLVSVSSAEMDVVAQMNYESRLSIVEEELLSEQQKDTNVGELAILFEGEPVSGTSSINANFAAQALLYFQGIVTRLFSVNLKGTLNDRGKIMGSELSELSLRELAHGSFGFVLEEKNAAQSSSLKTPLRESIEEATELFSEFSQEDDDAFLIDVNEINPRVFNEVAHFFKHLEKNNATLKAILPDKSYIFGRAEIERAYKRITDTHLVLTEEVWEGTLVGLSPIKRTFDFKRVGQKKIISGKFSHQISQDYLEKIERQNGIKLGGMFRAEIEIGVIRKSDGTVSTNYTVKTLEEL